MLMLIKTKQSGAAIYNAARKEFRWVSLFVRNDNNMYDGYA